MATPTSTNGGGTILNQSLATKVVLFPDGARLSAPAIFNYSASGAAVNVTVDAYAGLSDNVYTYTAQNSDIANRIIQLLDAWMLSSLLAVYDIAKMLNIAVFSITPTSQAHGSATSIAITGQSFSAPLLIGLINAGVTTTLATTFADSGDIAGAYLGNLAAGTYDVVILQNGSIASTLTGGLTLT